MSDVEEIAKAIQKTAQFGEKSLDSAEKLGGFFARVFQEPLEEIAGMVTDKLRFVRWRRLVQMGDEVNEILIGRNVFKSRAVPPKLALPIFEESSLEDDDELRKLWTKLLANAMDPNFTGEIRYAFIDMIKQITSLEVRILYNFYELLKKEDKISYLAKIADYCLTNQQIRILNGIDEVTYLISVYNLMRVQCVAPAVIKSKAMMIGNEQTTIFKGTDAIVLTPLGAKFVQACVL
ncbi:MAG: Abi-alpha family protein [Syntrophobacteraceae bacterium]|jgi:hypothetical protein